MKKFTALIAGLLLIVASVGVCSANYYDDSPDYFYIGIYGSGGYKNYLYLPSVEVQEYKPPHYQIAGDIVMIGGKKIISEIRLHRIIRYNWYTKESYSYYENRKPWERWKKDDVQERQYRNIADALFRAAYGIDFYGY